MSGPAVQQGGFRIVEKRLPGQERYRDRQYSADDELDPEFAVQKVPLKLDGRRGEQWAQRGDNTERSSEGKPVVLLFFALSDPLTLTLSRGEREYCRNCWFIVKPLSLSLGERAGVRGTKTGTLHDMLRNSVLPSTRSVPIARSLRRRLTKPENLLWRKLRDRRFHNLKFRRQAPVGNYIVDFLCVDQSVILELDGDAHLKKRTSDARRSLWLKSKGFKILRFSNDQITDSLDYVLTEIALACGVRTPSP